MQNPCERTPPMLRLHGRVFFKWCSETREDKVRVNAPNDTECARMRAERDGLVVTLSSTFNVVKCKTAFVNAKLPLKCTLRAFCVYFHTVKQWSQHKKKKKNNIQQKQAKRREAQHNIRTTAGEPEGAASDKMTSLTRAAPQPLSTAAATPTANRQTHARAPATKHLQLH